MRIIDRRMIRVEAYTLLRGKGPDFSSELELVDHCDHFGLN